MLGLKLNHVSKRGPGARFTNGFSIAIQIRWEFRFALISILMQWSLQNFAHDTTAVLSWHVQKFVAIWWPATELWQGEISIEFELRAKNRYWNGPWALNPSSADPDYKRDTNLAVTALINVLEISKLSADWAQSDMNFPTLF